TGTRTGCVGRAGVAARVRTVRAVRAVRTVRTVRAVRVGIRSVRVCAGSAVGSVIRAVRAAVCGIVRVAVLIRQVEDPSLNGERPEHVGGGPLPEGRRLLTVGDAHDDRLLLGAVPPEGHVGVLTLTGVEHDLGPGGEFGPTELL